MASPFPGMDPYLEDPRHWPDFHHGLISQVQAALNERLRPRYFASVEERVYISDQNDPGRAALVPDVHVVHGVAAPPSCGGPSSLAVAEPLVLTTLIEDEIRDAYLEIVSAEGRRVVTILEVTSPANKVTGSRGRASYMEKRLAVMRSRSHWVEIDLLRGGEPVVPLEVALLGDYFVHVSRVEERPRGLVWPLPLERRLPVVPIPLGTGDSDVKLDLQVLLDSVYERSAYDLKVNYGRDPIPSLSPGKADWVRERVRGRG